MENISMYKSKYIGKPKVEVDEKTGVLKEMG